MVDARAGLMPRCSKIFRKSNSSQPISLKTTLLCVCMDVELSFNVLGVKNSLMHAKFLTKQQDRKILQCMQCEVAPIQNQPTLSIIIIIMQIWENFI